AMLIDPVLGLGIEMRAADYRTPSRRRRWLHRNRSQLAKVGIDIAAGQIKPMRGRAADIKPAQRGGVDRARDRLAAVDQRDIHPELVAALDELPRTVEWIDQDEAAGMDRR